MFKVETYQDPREFFSRMQFEADTLHITGASSFRDYLKQKVPSADRKILTYEQLQKKLFDKWNDVFTATMLKAKMRKWIQQNPNVQDLLRRSILRSLNQWVDTFRWLVEADLLPISDPPSGQSSEESRLFAEIVRELCNDPQIRERILSRNPGRLSDAFQQEYGFLPKKIYVYHMIRLDLSRIIFFHQCADLGIEIVFRIPFIPQYADAYRVWTNLYSHLLPMDQWKVENSTRSFLRGQKFLAYLLGHTIQSEEQDPLPTKFYQFASPVHFLNYLEHTQESIVAVDHQRLNQALRYQDIYSQWDKVVGKFPSNRFLFYLYQCRKKGGTVWLDYPVLVECITSGWIQTEEANGLDAYSLLWDLEPYMKDIKNVDQVIDRLNRLEELVEVSRTFDDLAKEKTENSMIKKYLSNPFRAFSYLNEYRFSITIPQLRSLLIEFKQVANQLLPEENQQISFKKHLELLQQLYERVKSGLPLSAEEHELLRRKLYAPVLENFEASREELRDSMQILLSSSTEEPERINSNYQLEGLVLQSEEIHLTDLSILSLRNDSLSVKIEPLTFDWVKETIEQNCSVNERKKWLDALEAHKTLNQSNQAYFLFQLFFLLVFSEGSLTFSWIKGLRDHDEKSSYLELLYMLYGSHEEEIPFFPIPMQKMDFDPIAPVTQKEIDVGSLEGKIPVLYWIDEDYCARKFFYNSLVQLQPIYESDFHQQIVFASLANLFASLANGEQGVTEYLFPLFPQWTDTLKRNLLKTSYKSNIWEHRTFQNLTHPKAMEKIQRLYSRRIRVTERWKVNRAYQKNQNKDKEWLKELKTFVSDTEVQAEPGEYCMMCPYLMICDQGVFAIELK